MTSEIKKKITLETKNKTQLTVEEGEKLQEKEHSKNPYKILKNKKQLKTN